MDCYLLRNRRPSHSQVFKFIFESEIPEFKAKRKDRNTTRMTIYQSKYPLLNSGDFLLNSITDFLRSVEKKEIWFHDGIRGPEYEYNRLSLMYAFGCFFAWCKILKNESFIDRWKKSSEQKPRSVTLWYYEKNEYLNQFNSYYNDAFYSFTRFNDELITDKIRQSESEVMASSIPDLVIDSIGELMIKKQDGKNVLAEITFLEFTKNYNESDAFKNWFSQLERLFSNAYAGMSSIECQRIIVFNASLSIFVTFLYSDLWNLNPFEKILQLFRYLKIIKRDRGPPSFSAHGPSDIEMLDPIILQSLKRYWIGEHNPFSKYVIASLLSARTWDCDVIVAKEWLKVGDVQTIRARIVRTSSGKGISGIKTTLTTTSPQKQQNIIGDKYTDDNGIATFIFDINEKEPKGEYLVSVRFHENNQTQDTPFGYETTFNVL
jgi:hypothetical protein